MNNNLDATNIDETLRIISGLQCKDCKHFVTFDRVVYFTEDKDDGVCLNNKEMIFTREVAVICPCFESKKY